jgi:hypothetical protein
MGLKVNTIESVSGGPVSIPEVNIASGMSIPSWTPATSYVIGNIVRRNNTIYLVTADHTSQAVDANFYIDWLTNAYLTPMSSAPGDIIYRVGASDTGLLPLDGSDQLIASYPDLYNYLYGFTSPITYTFHELGGGNRVENNGGYAYFVIASHGFSTGDMVYITLDTLGSPTFAFANKPYFVQVVDANNFYISTENWSWTTNSGAANRLAYSAGMFGNTFTANNIYKTYWGRSMTPLTHFKLPDFRGITTRNSGTNGYMVKYNRTNFTSIAGKYYADSGLQHSHYYLDGQDSPPGSDGVGGYGVIGGNTDWGRNTNGTNETRANETEFAPAHVVVNAYIRF